MTLHTTSSGRASLKLLAVHTCTSACCVSLTVGNSLVSEACVRLERGLSTDLLGVIDNVVKRGGLDLSALDGIGVGIGPGSFTSIRIGMATVAGLALSIGKPVVGFTSLEMLALNVPYSALPVCTILDARKQEVYAAVYRTAGDLEEMVAPCVVDPEKFVDSLQGPTVFVGDGAARYRDLISSRLPEAVFPHAAYNDPRPVNGSILTIKAFAERETSVFPPPKPLYIRPSDAEMTTKKKVYV